MVVSHQQTIDEMSKVQVELKEALTQLIAQFGNKLKEKERQEIEKEFQEINEILNRLKTGLIYVALFGKTSVGKSAITNSLMNDDVAVVGVEHDKTTEVTAYKKEPWNIVDVPGVMGAKRNETLAIEEAKKANGHIFAIDSEPYEDELELFDLVHTNSPNIPKIVFVNKWDKIQNSHPKKEQEIIRKRIDEKMSKYVKSPQDIVYGSAMIFDPARDEMIRQELPQLLDRLYESAGSLGAIMNILDPAQRALDLNNHINNRVFAIREKLSRKVINIFATASVATLAVPGATIIGYPPLFISMVYTISKIMGKPLTKSDAGNIMRSCLKIMGVNATGGFTALVLTDLASTALTPIGGLGFAVAALAAIGGVGYFVYRETATLGEMTMEYIRNNFSWGGQNEQEVVKRCRERVKEHYGFKTA